MKLEQVLLLFFQIGHITSHIYLKNSVPYVKLRNGVLVGSRSISRAGRHYSAFEGIRYAEVSQRFGPPRPVSSEPWTAVKQATQPGARCPQVIQRKFIGQEDCLYLNLYVPLGSVVGTEPLPVMFYIQGGAFRFGNLSSTRGPHYFMDEDVVLVTVNHRLGPLGYLSTGDGVVPGNMGLKDQAIALKWVQKNIEAFGGDRNRVTIFGQSSGAASVYLHLFSPMSRGLFHRGIMQSGTASCVGALRTSDWSKQLANQLGQALKCPTETSLELVKCLKQRNVEEVTLAQMKLLRGKIRVSIFAPTIEPSTATSGNIFLSDMPDVLFQRNEFNKVPLIVGFTADEGLSFAAKLLLGQKPADDLTTNWNKIAPSVLHYDGVFQRNDWNIVSDKLKQFYFDENLIGWETYSNLTDLYTDAFFAYGVTRDVHMLAPAFDTYLYVMKFKGESTLKNYFKDKPIFGAAHADDLKYFFNLERLRNLSSVNFSRNAVRLWVSFATTGKPIGTWGCLKCWDPVSKAATRNSTLRMLLLDSDLKYVPNPFQIRFNFWSEIMKKHGVARYLLSP